MNDQRLEEKIAKAKKKIFINQQGLICHASYFNNISYLLENGLTVTHPDRELHILPSGINVTLMSYLIEQIDETFPARASFELEKGDGVVFLGNPANMHVP